MTITNELIAEKKRTEETIAEEMAKIRRNAVMLEPDTIAMLDELPIADADRELIRAWDGVLMPKGCYRTREATDILGNSLGRSGKSQERISQVSAAPDVERLLGERSSGRHT